MPTERTPQGPFPVGATPIAPMTSLRELTEMLVRKYDLHEGIYDLALEYRIGLGGAGPSEEQRYPTAMVSITSVGLTKAEKHGPTTVDAAQVNPAPKPKAKQRATKAPA